MRFDSYSQSDKVLEEKLKKELKNTEQEIENHKHEIERCQAEKQKILKQLTELRNEKNEEDMLALVYQQRRGGR